MTMPLMDAATKAAKAWAVALLISIPAVVTTASQAQSQQPSDMWAQFIINNNELIFLFECEEMIDTFAPEHPEAETTKSLINNKTNLVFSGMSDMFAMGGIYSVDQMRSNPLYEIIHSSFWEEMAAPEEGNEAGADNIIELCKTMAS